MYESTSIGLPINLAEPNAHFKVIGLLIEMNPIVITARKTIKIKTYFFFLIIIFSNWLQRACA